MSLLKNAILTIILFLQPLIAYSVTTQTSTNVAANNSAWYNPLTWAKITTGTIAVVSGFGAARAYRQRKKLEERMLGYTIQANWFVCCPTEPNDNTPNGLPALSSDFPGRQEFLDTNQEYTTKSLSRFLTNAVRQPNFPQAARGTIAQRSPLSDLLKTDSDPFENYTRQWESYDKKVDRMGTLCAVASTIFCGLSFLARVNKLISCVPVVFLLYFYKEYY